MKVWRFVGTIVERHPVAIVMAVLVLTALAAWSASGISIVTTQEAFLSPDSPAFQGYKANEEAFGGDSLVALIPGSPEELTNKETLKALADLHAKLGADPRIRSVVSPYTLLQSIAAQQGIDISSPDFDLEAMLSDETARTQFARFYSNGHIIVAVRLAGGLTTDEQSAAATFIQDTVAASPLGSGAIVAGTPGLIADIKDAITSDLARTGAIAVVLMVLILFVAFPVRWRLLSLPVVLIGVLWTFGVASALDVPLTLVTLACLPVLIGLGVDFSIQFHNRYDEEMRRGETRAAAIVDAISHIGPAVGAAVVVMVLGFLTLFISRVPAVRDFGVVLAIGAVILYVAGLFVLNAVLHQFDRRATSNRSADGGRSLLTRDWLHLAVALPAVARWSRRHAVWVLVIAVLLAAGGFVADRHLDVQTDIEKLIPTDTPGVVALDQARDIVGGSLELPFLIQAQDVLAPDVTAWMAEFQTKALAAHPELLSAQSMVTSLGIQPGGPTPPPEASLQALEALPSEIRDGLVTTDRTGASVVFGVDQMPISNLNTLIDKLIAEADPPEGVTLVPGGTMTLAARAVSTTTEHRGLMTVVGIVVVFLGLFVIYRNWRRAIIATVPIALVTGWSSAFMWITGVDLNPLTAVLGALVIAIGTEFTVLLLSRYWEERSRGTNHDQAVEQAVGRVGRAITASALTVAGGFGALIASSFPVLRDFGIVTVVDVIFALIVTLTVVPSLVHLLDRGGARSASGQQVTDAATRGAAFP